MVSPKHPNFIVNAFDATANDVKALISLVKNEVYEKFKKIGDFVKKFRLYSH